MSSESYTPEEARALEIKHKHRAITMQVKYMQIICKMTKESFMLHRGRIKGWYFSNEYNQANINRFDYEL